MCCCGCGSISVVVPFQWFNYPAPWMPPYPLGSRRGARVMLAGPPATPERVSQAAEDSPYYYPVNSGMGI